MKSKQYKYSSESEDLSEYQLSFGEKKKENSEKDAQQTNEFPVTSIAGERAKITAYRQIDTNQHQ